MPNRKLTTRRKTQKRGGALKSKKQNVRRKSVRSYKTKKSYRRRVGSGLCMGKMCRGQKNTNGTNNANASNRTANANAANRTANANAANRTANANRTNNTARVSTNMIRTNNGKANNSIPSVSSFDVPSKVELKDNIESIQRYYDDMVKDKVSSISSRVQRNRNTLPSNVLAQFERSTKPITAKYNSTASISDRMMFITTRMANLEREVKFLSENSNTENNISIQKKIVDLRDIIRSFSDDLDTYISRYNMRINPVSMNNVKFN